MADKPLLECSFLIPLRRDANLSEGKPHSPKAWRWLETELLQFGGGTREALPVEGWYVDPDTGQPVHDASRRYILAVPRADLADLRALLGEACRVFQQKCIYLSIAGRVEFVKGTTDDEE